MNNSNSFNAGIEAAKLGHSIDNSYPFDHEEFVKGYKSIKPDARTLLDKCPDSESKLTMMKIIELSK